MGNLYSMLLPWLRKGGTATGPDRLACLQEEIQHDILARLPAKSI